MLSDRKGEVSGISVVHGIDSKTPIDQLKHASTLSLSCLGQFATCILFKYPIMEQSSQRTSFWRLETCSCKAFVASSKRSRSVSRSLIYVAAVEIITALDGIRGPIVIASSASDGDGCASQRDGRVSRRYSIWLLRLSLYLLSTRLCGTRVLADCCEKDCTEERRPKW